MIIIDENYSIDADTNQYIVVQKKVSDKTGEEYLDRIAYCGTLKQAIQALLRHDMRLLVANSTISLSEALEAVKTAENRFEEMLNKFEEVDV